MASKRESVSAVLTDEERIEAWESLVEQSGESKSDLLRMAIDSLAADEIDDAGDDQNDLDEQDYREYEKPGDGWYDPTEAGLTLSSKELKQIIGNNEQPAINPDHLPPMEIPLNSTAQKTMVLAAVCRFRMWREDRWTQRDTAQFVNSVINTTIGEGADNYNIDTYGRSVTAEIKGDEEVEMTHNKLSRPEVIGLSVVSKFDNADEVDDWLETADELIEEAETELSTGESLDSDLEKTVASHNAPGKSLIRFADTDIPPYSDVAERVERMTELSEGNNRPFGGGD